MKVAVANFLWVTGSFCVGEAFFYFIFITIKVRGSNSQDMRAMGHFEICRRRSGHFLELLDPSSHTDSQDSGLILQLMDADSVQSRLNVIGCCYWLRHPPACFRAPFNPSCHCSVMECLAATSCRLTPALTFGLNPSRLWHPGTVQVTRIDYRLCILSAFD
jgi:hypothetical protein